MGVFLVQLFKDGDLYLSIVHIELLIPADLQSHFSTTFFHIHSFHYLAKCPFIYDFAYLVTVTYLFSD